RPRARRQRRRRARRPRPQQRSRPPHRSRTARRCPRPLPIDRGPAMSYILDALRRADAERERGAIPGLSSQQHAYVEDDAARPRRPRALVWTVAALAAALAIAVGWNLVGGGGQPQRA